MLKFRAYFRPDFERAHTARNRSFSGYDGCDFGRFGGCFWWCRRIGRLCDVSGRNGPENARRADFGIIDRPDIIQEGRIPERIRPKCASNYSYLAESGAGIIPELPEIIASRSSRNNRPYEKYRCYMLIIKGF